MVRFVTTSWVEERLGDAETLALDPRGRMRYLRGHLLGAVNLPIDRLFGADGRLLEPSELARLLGETGLDDTRTPVIYDSYDGQRGAMMAWVLEYLGRADACLMDTFFDGWTAQQREIFYRPVEPEQMSFTHRVEPGVRAATADVRTRRAEKLLDVRSPEEFEGSSETDPRPGHIPGAANVPWTEFSGPGHDYLAPSEEIGRRLEERGIGRRDKIIAYCRVGMRAALGYVALRQTGYDVRLYDGSYAEWSGEGLPVDKPGKNQGCQVKSLEVFQDDEDSRLHR